MTGNSPHENSPKPSFAHLVQGAVFVMSKKGIPLVSKALLAPRVVRPNPALPQFDLDAADIDLSFMEESLRTRSEWPFHVACDMPCVTHAFLGYLSCPTCNGVVLEEEYTMASMSGLEDRSTKEALLLAIATSSEEQRAYRATLERLKGPAGA